MKLTEIKPRLRELQPRVRQLPGGSWRAGKTTAQRGYGSRWQRERAAFLEANGLCVYCRRNGRVVRATIVDHIEPHRGDERLFWDRANWQPLCKPCHDEVKRAEEAPGG